MRTINIPTLSGRIRSVHDKIDLIVLHGMSEYIEHETRHIHATEFLKKQGLSCHYMVTPGASIIKCADPKALTTWHAKRHNFNSVGVEILLPGINSYEDFKWAMQNIQWISYTQESALVLLCRELMDKYNMQGAPKNHIKLHCQLDPKRKIDPGVKHNWNKFYQRITKLRNDR